MRPYFRPILISAAVLAATLFSGAHLFLKSRIVTGEFKNFAESKAAELFKARVQIGNIRLGLLNQVSLSGLEVASAAGEQNPYQFKVDQIVFRYSLYQLLTRNLKMPAQVVLQAPEFIFQSAEFPYLFFQNLNFGSRNEKLSSLEIAGGQFRVPIPAFDSELVLRDIHGMLTPGGPGRIEVKFEALSSGILAGRVKLRGEIRPAEKTHNLVLEFAGVSAGANLPLPLKALTGMIRWDGDRFLVEHMKGQVHGWDSQMKGELSSYRAGAPLLALDLSVGKDSMQAGIALRADFASSEFFGKIKSPGVRDHFFKGDISRQDMTLIFKELRVDDIFDGEGDIDLRSGDANFKFEKLNQRISAATNLQSFDFRLQFTVEHAKVAGLDLVTAARIHLMPVVLPGEGRIWKFRSLFETDFFILNTVPFKDFKGEFEISPFGVRNLKASWGEVFDAEGGLSLSGEKPGVNLTVRVNGFDLATVQEFAAKPLPKKLGGLLEGKLRITGNYDHPEIQGKFSVKSGQVGKLKYDRGIYQFRGFPPYLPLQESRILKGRTVLLLTGALDLKLKNMFHGVRIETLDKIVIWHGWEINTSREEGDFEIDNALTRFPSLIVKAGGSTKHSDSNDRDEGDPFVGVGPKLKF